MTRFTTDGQQLLEAYRSYEDEAAEVLRRAGGELRPYVTQFREAVPKPQLFGLSLADVQGFLFVGMLTGVALHVFSHIARKK